MYKFLLVTVFSGLLLFACSFRYASAPSVAYNNAALAVYKTRYVVILVIDGPRWTETFGDTSCRYIPYMGKELVNEGVLFTSFYNNGSTTTTSGHTAITTGLYQHISNGGKELPKRPNMFQYFLKSTNADKTKAWLISSKGKLEILAGTKDKDWWNVYMPSTYCGPNGNSSSYSGDPGTVAKVKQVIDTYHPQLMLINLLEVDTHGHGNDWEGYKRGIVNCDRHAYDLWNFIQEDPEMKDQTTLFITNDHGRHLDGHKDGFVNHGDNCLGCRHISLLAMGPDFPKGKVVTSEAELIDITATVSQMMGFAMPTQEGRFLKELF